jgi:1-acyl-sn-glycerol-3-phosphate acyltransferase
VFAAVRIALATFATYLLGFSLTGIGVLLGIGAALIGWQGFVTKGTMIWTHFVFWLVGRIPHVRGKENIAPGTPYLVVANHSSMYDIPALMATVPGVALLGRDYLLRIPGFGKFLRILHYVPIDTSSGRSARAALDLAAQRIEQGIPVGIFPEGTRTPDGRVQPLKRGFITILRKSGADLLPVSISGTYALKPKGKLTMNPRERIEITVGAPIPNTLLTRLDDGQIQEKVRRTLERMGEKR